MELPVPSLSSLTPLTPVSCPLKHFSLMISKMFAILDFFLTFHHTKFQLPHFSFSYNRTTHLVFLVAPDGSNCSLSPFPCEVTVQLPEHACSELARCRIILEKTRPPLAFGFFSPTHEAFLAQQQDWHHIDLFWEPVQSINRVLKWAKTLQMDWKNCQPKKIPTQEVYLSWLNSLHPTIKMQLLHTVL